MSDVKIFEDIYEPIPFKIKNRNGDLIDCQSAFRNLDANIELEELGKFKKDDTVSYNQKMCRMMVLLCGQTEDFWKQFQDSTLNSVIEYVYEKEKEKYKKKQAMK